MVKVGGGRLRLEVIYVFFIIIIYYFIWFLGQDINWDIVLFPAPVAIFIYFILLYISLSNEFYILIYILLDRMQESH